MTTIRVSFPKTLISRNSKTGPIFVSTSEMSSCPDRCPFRGDCYASAGRSALNWMKVPERGVSWGEFVDVVAALPAGSLWRHNEAGDLPTLSDGITLDRAAILALAQASAKRGKRGFTYTHHALTAENVETIREALRIGFTINASCETPAQVDHAKSLGIPAVIVVPKGERPPKGATTDAGAPVRSCPAESSEITCSNCGICARGDRQAVIAFEAHGALSKRIGVAIRTVSSREAVDGVAR